MNKNIDFLKKNIIAHRGLHNNDNPENSMGAFKRAIDKGYIIELDVHLTKDNKVVVFHDDNLKRMTGVDKDIRLVNKKELDKIYLGNTLYTIPTLRKVLELIDGKVEVIIEIKSDNKVGLLERELVKILDNYKGEFAVKSFRLSSILWFRINRPNYVRGILVTYTSSRFRKFIDNYFVYKLLCDPDFLSCYYKLGIDNKIKKLREKIIVLGWTIRSREDYNKYINYFDNLICENIDN